MQIFPQRVTTAIRNLGNHKKLLFRKTDKFQNYVCIFKLHFQHNTFYIFNTNYIKLQFHQELTNIELNKLTFLQQIKSPKKLDTNF